MKKFAIIVFVIGLLVLLFSCGSPSRDSNDVRATETNWTIEVSYLDNVKDTLLITTPYDDCSCGNYEPEIETYNGVSTLRMNYQDKASYVKSFRVLSKTNL